MHIIIGNTEYSIMLKNYIETSGISIDAFCVDREFIKDSWIENRPVIAIEDLKKTYSPDSTLLFLGIGYKNLGKVKRRVFEKLKEKGFRFESYVHPSAEIYEGNIVGEGNVIFENVVFQRNAVIGDGNLFFSNATVMHDCSVGNFNTLGAGSVTNGFVKIGNCNFIGSNATIKDHVEIHDNNLIGASAYVNKDLADDFAILPAQSKKVKCAEMIGKL